MSKDSSIIKNTTPTQVGVLRLVDPLPGHSTLSVDHVRVIYPAR